jgi:hypothetical protein
MLHLFELNWSCKTKKAAAPATAGVTASVNTVSLTSVNRYKTRRTYHWSFSYGLNLIFLVVTSAAMGNPSWILSFSISPCPSSAQ